MTDATFTVQQIESGTEVDEAAVAFAAPTVTVDGAMLNQRENPGHQAGRESRTLR